MKRLVVALLTLALVFSGCSGTKKDNKDNTEVKATPTLTPLNIDESKLNNDYIIEEVVEDNTKEGFESIIKYPKVSNMVAPELEARVNDAIKERIQKYKEVALGLGEAAEEISDDDSKIEQVLNVSYEVTFRSKYILSIKLILENYIINFEEPDEIIDSVNVDLRTGLKFSLQDVIKDTNKLSSLLTKKVQESGLTLLQDIKSLEDVSGFYIRETGLVLYVQTVPYTTPDIGPLEFEIPYEDIKDIIKDTKFFEKEPASTSMNEYKDTINEETRPFEALSFIDEKIKTVKQEEATTMILSFEEIQSRYLEIYEESLQDEVIQNELLKTFEYNFDQEKVDEIKDERVKSLVKEILNGGYIIICEEGSFIPIQNYQVLDKYSRFLQSDIRDYISYKAAETERIANISDGYLTSWDELAQNIIKIENYLGKYPNSIKESEMISDYQFYFHAYLFGFDNRPAFNYETKKIDNELLFSYKRFVQDNEKSETAMILKEYIQVIEKNDNTLCEEVENYRRSITEDPRIY